LQFYINGMALMIWDNVQLVPRLVSLIASFLSIPLFFALAARLFGREKAWPATACFSLYALHIKYGNIAGSESLFVMTVLLTMYAYSRLLSKQSAIEILLLGGALLLAAMIRFEAWLLPPFIAAAVILRSWRSDHPAHRRRLLVGAVAACIPASLFIMIWMYGSYQQYGDVLYSIHAAASEHGNLTAQSIGSTGNLKILIYRALFWPGVILISLSPLVLLCSLRGSIKSVFQKTNPEWAVFLAIIICIYLYQSLIAGKLAPLARYTILPGTILCLYSAPGFSNTSSRSKSLLTGILNPRIVLVTALCWSILLIPNHRNSDSAYLKKLASVSPVTRYPASLEPVIQWLEVNLQREQTVLFNSPFFTSNAIIMYSGILPGQFIAANEHNPDDIIRKFESASPTFFICHQNAPLFEFIEVNPADSSIMLNNNILHLREMAGDFGIYIPKY
jgi:4-amino-4-deoxy-L-arabinose transferase-like glycosyltransferase